MEDYIYCNPLNLPYRFQQLKGHDHVYREGADPSLVLFQGRYWLFASMSLGAWHSDNLIDWRFQEMPDLPKTDYAPDVRVIGEYVYFSASRKIRKCTIYRSEDLLAGEWERVSSPFTFWDPNIFQDDDGRVYLYWGCSNSKPIYGVELSEAYEPIGKPVPLFNGSIQEHGWERIGENNQGVDQNTDKNRVRKRKKRPDPYIEGAWMTKHQGKYYLQYAAPGTEYNIYGDGVYVGNSPLGPFEYASHNPFSLKPGGYITGAGHGSTFHDKYGNLWHISTMVVGVNYRHERRIGLFPAAFDKDGILCCNTNFADYPIRIPTRKIDPWEDAFPPMMLLSYQKKVTASSNKSGYLPEYVVDENIKTVWATEDTDQEPAIQIDLGEVCLVQAVQINFSEVNCKAFHVEKHAYTGELPFMKRAIAKSDSGHGYHLLGSDDGRIWHSIEDKRAGNEDVPHDFIYLGEGRGLRYIRLENNQMPYGGNFALSGLRVFGMGNGSIPRNVSWVRSERLSDVDVRLLWEEIKEAQGYNVRWGIAPQKLYSSWMVYKQNTLVLSSLNKSQTYWYEIDIFNENGVQKGIKTYMISG